MSVNRCIKVLTTLYYLITTFNNCKLLAVSELNHVYCNKEFIALELPLTPNRSELFIKNVYWQNLYANSAKECQPLYHTHGIKFKISLENSFKCGFRRSVNKWKDQISYSQDLVIKRNLNSSTKISVKCSYKVKVNINKIKHKITKRSASNDDFLEDSDIEILDTIEEKAAIPEVFLEVRQNEKLIDGTVTVIPGTPLIMEVKLNEMANNIYGLHVKYLEVSDTIDMSETILFRGCTVDPYLFENFFLTKRNSLKSKFRAFKFPNTGFVRFRANVQICLKSCSAPQCIGNGSNTRDARRRREVDFREDHTHEVDTGIVLKINDTFKGSVDEFLTLQNHINSLLAKNMRLLK